MARKSFFLTLLVLSASLSAFAGGAGAQPSEKTIYTFDLTHGIYPISGLVADSAGNLYGTTNNGGLYPDRKNPCCGAVFELSPGSNGAWSETVIYAFQGLSDGMSPYGTLAFDKQGNLYGTNYTYGLASQSRVFQLSKGSSGKWTDKTVYTFAGNVGQINGDLTLDGEGNIYGTTQNTGSSDGTVFELSPQADGTWKETVLYAFPKSFPLGNPHAGVTFDAGGNLYGTTDGSSTGYGGVYELSQSNGTWTAAVLFTFTGGNAGGEPDDKLIFDSSGNLYGVCSGNNNGVVFELSPGSNGIWTETVLHAFPVGPGSDGAHPQGTLVFDSRGNLYGTAPAGGLGCNGGSCGVVYELSPQSGGTWKETILHQFESAGDGSQPQAGLYLDSAGNLFGTTKFGGTFYGYGTIFEITP